MDPASLASGLSPEKVRVGGARDLGHTPYPLMGTAGAFRAWLEKESVPYAELHFRHYRVKPWAGQDLRGSGLAYAGLPQDLAAEKIASVAQELVGAFEGKRHGDRRLDLELSSSVRKPGA